MNEKERRALGEETMRDVYAGDIAAPPGENAFVDTMLKQLFAELWTRQTLSMRDKRLLVLGIIADKGEAGAFQVHLRAALKRGELSVDEARELLLFIAQYAGYPRAAAMLAAVEQAVGEFEKGKTGE